MGSCKILIKPSAVREIESVPKKDRVRIVRRIQALLDIPRPAGCEKVSGEEKFRLRHGVYRIVYSIEDGAREVVVVKVAHRREVYR